MDPFSSVVSVLSLAISILALWSSHKNSARLVKIEEERDKAVQFQAAQASLRASLEREASQSRWLTVWNEGQGTATGTSSRSELSRRQTTRVSPNRPVNQTPAAGAMVPTAEAHPGPGCLSKKPARHR